MDPPPQQEDSRVPNGYSKLLPKDSNVLSEDSEILPTVNKQDNSSDQKPENPSQVIQLKAPNKNLDVRKDWTKYGYYGRSKT